MDKDILISLLTKGMSTRDIAKKIGKSQSTVNYWIKRYDIVDLQKCKKNDNFLFNKIDTKEKAYILGFILANGYISHNKDVKIVVDIRDSEIIEYISKTLKSNVIYDNTFNKKQRRFPKAYTKKRIKDICKFTGGRLKQDRHFPRIKKELERYLLLGFFDGDGCVTWGKRKDRNRIWHKISFTSQLKLLEGVQQMLINKLDISTIVRPKSKGNCYVLEFSHRRDVLKFLDYIYQDDFIVLKRKYSKSKALRLELEEFGGTTTR